MVGVGFKVAMISSLMSPLAEALRPSDFEITALPDAPNNLGFKQYAGLMPVNGPSEPDARIFFWFVESQDTPASDPVVLWMNGGPGSSSVAYGFWTEHGPFRLTSEGKPELYDQSWNRHANVVYIESPVGVGFSYADNRAKYQNITDAESSFDNLMFLKNFFATFDDFKANPFYITAESYGGHYGPTLAEQLIDHENDEWVQGVNMKGLLIGNPGINSDWYYNVNEYAFVTFSFHHGLIPASSYVVAKDACGWDDFLTNCSADYTHPSRACEVATENALRYIPSPLDPYNVIAPTCQNDAKKVDARVVEYTPHLDHLRTKYGLDLEYNPCINDYTPEYMNRPDVLDAIHVAPHYTRRWPRHPPTWSYNEGPQGAKKDIALLFPKFFARRPEWKIAVISGDVDAAVPFIGSERWIDCLGRAVTQDWRAWKLDGDVAGMIKRYSGIDFVTVKGCGHTIPTYCPKKGYAFFANWVADSW